MILEKRVPNDTQLGRVYNVMKDGKRRALWDIQDTIRRNMGKIDGETAISARLRDLRKEGYTVERDRKTHHYWLVVCPHCNGRKFGAYLSDASGLDDWCPECDGEGLAKR